MLPVDISYVQAHTTESHHGLAMFTVGSDRGDLHVINSESFSYKEARLALSITVS